MKARLFILSLCCAIAAVSCQKEEKTKEPTKGPVTITLSRDDIGTKTTLTTSGAGLNRVWSASDKVSVIDAYGNNEMFTLVSGAGTATATFLNASSVYATGTHGIRIIYPYTNTKDGYNWWIRSMENQGTGSLANLGNYDFLYRQGNIVDGIYTSGGTFNSQSTFFKIPSGIKFLNTTGSSTIETMVLEETANKMGYRARNNSNSNSAAVDNGSVTLENIPLTDGALTQDVYISFIYRPTPDYNFNLKIKLVGNATIYTFPLMTSEYLTNNHIYNFTQAKFTPKDI